MSSSTATLPKPPFNAFVVQNNRNTIRTNKTPSISTETKPQLNRPTGTDTFDLTALAADPVAEKMALDQEFAKEALKHNLEQTDKRSWLNNILSAFRISPAKERSNIIALNPRQQPQQQQPNKLFLAVA